MTSFRQTKLFSSVLHVLVPGLGHLFWKEYAFGIFVFLVMLMASALFFLSFLVSIPWLVKALLLGLPAIFYLFSFLDLSKSIASRQEQFRRTRMIAWVFFVAALAFQILAPHTPVNFFLRNLPDVYAIDDNNLSPVFSKGDIVTASALPYSVDLFFLDFPIYHDLPAYFDVVRFTDTTGRKLTGVVIGLPGEGVRVEDGRLEVDGYPKYRQGRGKVIQTGNWPLTSVDDNSILVASLNLGRVDTVYQVPFGSLIGKVDRLF
jgi:hypothetical protein